MSAPQHMQALELANKIRFKQVAALREVRAGGSIESVLFSDDPELGSIPIGRLLKARRGQGAYRVATLCRRLDLNEHRPIRKLTDRQKVELVAAVNEGGTGRVRFGTTVAATQKIGAAPRLTRPAPRPKEKTL